MKCAEVHMGCSACSIPAIALCGFFVAGVGGREGREKGVFVFCLFDTILGFLTLVTGFLAPSYDLLVKIVILLLH